jgi:AhpD family alkylhydroperoxidase
VRSRAPAEGYHHPVSNKEDCIMARLPYHEPIALTDQPEAATGPIRNVRRMLAHSPELARRWSQVTFGVLNLMRVDPRLRELALLTIGRVTGAAYEYAHHVNYARRAGVTEEQIDAIADWERNPAFSDQERAVIRYAEAMTRDLNVPDEAFEPLRTFFDEQQIVELTLAISVYNGLARFLIALQVDLDAPDEL